jgi:hypothetical protein
MNSPILSVRSITDEELKSMLREAAEWGAKRALADIGLHDDDAGDDVKELRGLLESWRQAKNTAFKTVISWLTTGLLILIIGGVYYYVGKDKG